MRGVWKEKERAEQNRSTSPSTSLSHRAGAARGQHSIESCRAGTAGTVAVSSLSPLKKRKQMLFSPKVFAATVSQSSPTAAKSFFLLGVPCVFLFLKKLTTYRLFLAFIKLFLLTLALISVTCSIWLTCVTLLIPKMASSSRDRRTVVADNDEDDLANVEFETSEEVDVIPTFDSMGLREDLLRGIYAYGKCIRHSFIGWRDLTNFFLLYVRL